MDSHVRACVRGGRGAQASQPLCVISTHALNRHLLRPRSVPALGWVLRVRRGAGKTQALSPGSSSWGGDSERWNE